MNKIRTIVSLLQAVSLGTRLSPVEIKNTFSSQNAHNTIHKLNPYISQL